MTKKFEETMRGSLAELLDYFAVQQPRGEFVITVAGSTGSEGAEAEITEGDIKLALQELLDRGFTKKAAVQEVASRYRLPKNRIYKLALDLD